jgi:hypothetical protein
MATGVLNVWVYAYVCMLSLDIEDRKALDEVKKRKERKPRQTCNARLWKVSPSCTRAPPAFDLSLSLSFFACVGRVFPFSLSPSAHVDLIYADYFTITIDHSCVERKKARRKRARVAHTKGQLDRATRTIKEWVKQEHDFSFIIVIMAVDASTDFL